MAYRRRSSRYSPGRRSSYSRGRSGYGRRRTSGRRNVRRSGVRAQTVRLVIQTVPQPSGDPSSIGLKPASPPKTAKF